MAKGIKTGGRKKGVPNKLTGELKEMISTILSNEIKKIPEQLNELEPKDRLIIITKLLPYVIPKTQNTNEKIVQPIFKLVNVSQTIKKEKSS